MLLFPQRANTSDGTSHVSFELVVLFCCLGSRWSQLALSCSASRLPLHRLRNPLHTHSSRSFDQQCIAGTHSLADRRNHIFSVLACNRATDRHTCQLSSADNMVTIVAGGQQHVGSTCRHDFPAKVLMELSAIAGGIEHVAQHGNAPTW